jgi:hypothetical protein
MRRDRLEKTEARQTDRRPNSAVRASARGRVITTGSVQADLADGNALMLLDSKGMTSRPRASFCEN